MKMEEYIESIFGCLERIENKINGLSDPLPEGNSPTGNTGKEKDESVLNEVRNDHETFRKLLARVCEGLVAIKNDMGCSGTCGRPRQKQDKMPGRGGENRPPPRRRSPQKNPR